MIEKARMNYRSLFDSEGESGEKAPKATTSADVALLGRSNVQY